MNWRGGAYILTSQIPNRYNSQSFTGNLQWVEGPAARAHFSLENVQPALDNWNQEFSTSAMQGHSQSGSSRAARKVTQKTNLTLIPYQLGASLTCTIREISN